MKHKGFTLIELMVVISIISIMSSVVLTNISSGRTQARDSIRIQNVRTLQAVLELYLGDHGEYPRTFNPGSPQIRYAECLGDPDDYIPNVVPAYIQKLPSDPALNCNSVTHSWFYASDGHDYKLVTHMENVLKSNVFADPSDDGGSNPCTLDGADRYHAGAWTPGALCWVI
jgi:prepilin-type N-terminal cleavage/methylation domain-containing protein